MIKLAALFSFIVLMVGPWCLAERTGFPIYHETNRYTLGGDGGWDYLFDDSAEHRLYIARSDRIMVVDTDNGKVVGEVPDTDGAHGIAIAPKATVGFATAGKAGSVTVFNLKTLKVEKHIAVGQKPDAIVYDPESKKVFVFDGGSKDCSVIDPKDSKVVATIPLDGKPEFAASDGAGKVFVNIEDKSELAVIDSKTLKVLKNYPLTPCERPTGLSMDPKTEKLIVGCSNNMAAIVDGKTGAIDKTFGAGHGIDATTFDPEQRIAVISAGEGKLTLLHERKNGKFEHFQDLTTQGGARTTAIDPKTSNIFLVTAQFGPRSSPAPGETHKKPNILPGSFTLIVIGQ